MPFIRYTAKREIASGRVMGTVYDFELFAKILSPKNTTVGTTVIAISGATQSVIERREKVWQVSTLPLYELDTDYRQMYEFLESVDEGEQFEFDATDTGNFSICVLEKNYTRDRVEQNPEYSFSFSLRIVY